jgi:nitrogen regulatory protein P-II 2
MKYIIAIIQPGKLTAVHNALLEMDFAGMTVTEVQGYGRQKGKSEIYRGAEYTVHFLPKIKIELAVPAKLAVKAVEVIKGASITGKIGDGKIFTFDLQDAVRIRTSETGEGAL